MTLDEREIEDVLDRLDRLKAVVVDSSSIIYLSKSQFLDDVAGEIRMITIPQVVDETGIRGLPVIVVEPPSIEDVTETDRLLVAAAARQKKPMLSEDRAILLTCQREGMEYYNAYNMLVMLWMRGVIGENEFRLREEKLLEVSHYGKFVIDYISSLVRHLRKVL